MAIFISYSHENKAFVDQLAMQLVANNQRVWLDRWELSVGDSILQRVQDAIRGASALLVILSKASTSSEWCKKELTAGMVRELEEKRVVVLPVIIDDCEIPLFLRDKLYADFRQDPDKALQSVLDAIESVSNANQGRIQEVNGFVDWSVDWGYVGANFKQMFTIVQTSPDLAMTFLTQISVNYNEPATKRYEQYVEAGVDWIGRKIVGESLFDLGQKHQWLITLADQFEKHHFVTMRDTGASGIAHEIIISCRRLGEANGKAQVVNISNYLLQIRDYINSMSRKPSADELTIVAKIISTPPPRAN